MWLRRRWQSAKAWFGRQERQTYLLFGAVILTSPCWCGCGGLWLRGQYVNLFVYTDEDRAFLSNEQDKYPGADGLPSVARRLKAEMETIPDPDTALRLHPDWVAIRFDNGEWVFGHGINSHGFRPGRGTLVLKDSRGRVRVFFGHVCGPNGGIDSLALSYWNLNKLYARLEGDGIYREWVPDQ